MVTAQELHRCKKGGHSASECAGVCLAAWKFVASPEACPSFILVAAALPVHQMRVCARLISCLHKPHHLPLLTGIASLLCALPAPQRAVPRQRVHVGAWRHRCLPAHPKVPGAGLGLFALRHHCHAAPRRSQPGHMRQPEPAAARCAAPPVPQLRRGAARSVVALPLRAQRCGTTALAVVAPVHRCCGCCTSAFRSAAAHAGLPLKAGKQLMYVRLSITTAFLFPSLIFL